MPPPAKAVAVATAGNQNPPVKKAIADAAANAEEEEDPSQRARPHHQCTLVWTDEPKETLPWQWAPDKAKAGDRQ